jgi:uncharacterized BrkB/YihY/UPF0761 family membrane protein
MAAVVGISAAVSLASLLGAVISAGITANYAFNNECGASMKTASFFSVVFIIIAIIALIVLTAKATTLSRKIYKQYKVAPSAGITQWYEAAYPNQPAAAAVVVAPAAAAVPRARVAPPRAHTP